MKEDKLLQDIWFLVKMFLVISFMYFMIKGGL